MPAFQARRRALAVSAVGVVLLVAAAATWARDRPAAMSEEASGDSSKVILQRVEAALEAGRERDQKAHNSDAFRGEKAGGGGAGKSPPQAFEKVRSEVLGVMKRAAEASLASPGAAERELERARQTDVFHDHKAPLDAGSVSISRAERDGRREAQQGEDGEEAARKRAAAAAATDYAKSREKMMAREMAQVSPPAIRRERARAHQSGGLKKTETELGLL
ncbi:hypothetical protein T484DRAFT_2151405 [Baffinella frigidus]|nr:hypothetical protein T484DRAFT_2151405 [Cryptophyta sp. CCMP2293]